MAEPDFTNPELANELADVIKQEPVEQEHEESDEQMYGVDDFLFGDEEHIAQLSPSQLPKPENEELAREALYTAQDLDGGVNDSRCAIDWPLAHLWPVYIDNFRCTSRPVCPAAIRQYFASKGLLVRWFFFLNDDYSKQFQQKANLFDGLVYFGSERDAQQAIKHCDHSIYNGYTMNVFPGRDPVFFPANRSLMYKNMGSGLVYSEEFFMRHMVRRFGGVRCVVKYDIKNGAVEFYTEEQKRKAFTEERQFKGSPVASDRTLQKQRFVEANVQQQILAALRQDPNALTMNPSNPLFGMLQAGLRPTPMGCSGPPARRGGGCAVREGEDPNIRPIRRGPNKYQQQTKFNNKLKKFRREIEKAVAEGREPKRFGAKSKSAKQRFNQIYNQVLKEQRR